LIFARRKPRLGSTARPPMAVWGPAALVGAAMTLPLVYLVLRGLEKGWAEVFEVVLREGHVIRVPGSFDAAALRRLIAALDGAHEC